MRGRKLIIEKKLQPHELPVIDLKKLFDQNGSVKLNPWFFKGKKHRIVGYGCRLYLKNENDESFTEEYGDYHCIKCETTGSYQYKTTQQLKKLVESL